jgi:hypothetical protein
MRNEAVKAITKTIKTLAELLRRLVPNIDKPTPDTSKMLITRSLASIMLKPNLVEGRGG